MDEKTIEIAKAAGSFAEDVTGCSYAKVITMLVIIGWPFVLGACCIIAALALLPEV